MPHLLADFASDSAGCLGPTPTLRLLPTPTLSLRLGAQMDKAEMLLREIRAEVAAKREWLHQDKPDYSEVRAMGQAESQVGSVVPCEQDREMGMIDPLVEDAVVQTIITRLYDPRYAEDLSLADIMQSDEMLGLSGSSRERVVSEIVGMMNRGEVNSMSAIRAPQ